MKTSIKIVGLLTCLVAACQLAFAGHRDSEYKTGTLISWGAGGTHCSGFSVGKSVSAGAANCNPGGDNLYHVSIENHEYLLTRGEDNEGIFGSKPDPLRSLLPSDKFQYRIDNKNRKLWVLDKNGKEARYTIRGVQ